MSAHGTIQRHDRLGRGHNGVIDATTSSGPCHPPCAFGSMAGKLRETSSGSSGTIGAARLTSQTPARVSRQQTNPPRQSMAISNPCRSRKRASRKQTSFSAVNQTAGCGCAGRSCVRGRGTSKERADDARSCTAARGLRNPCGSNQHHAARPSSPASAAPHLPRRARVCDPKTGGAPRRRC